MSTLTPPRADRRRGLRIAFAEASRAPSLRLGDGTHAVVDLSPTGLRLRHLDPVRPAIGHRLQGVVHASDGTGEPIDGRIAWTSPTEIGVELDRLALPLGFVMSLVARERDRLE